MAELGQAQHKEWGLQQGRGRGGFELLAAHETYVAASTSECRPKRPPQCSKPSAQRPAAHLPSTLRPPTACCSLRPCVVEAARAMRMQGEGAGELQVACKDRPPGGGKGRYRSTRGPQPAQQAPARKLGTQCSDHYILANLVCFHTIWTVVYSEGRSHWSNRRWPLQRMRARIAAAAAFTAAAPAAAAAAAALPALHLTARRKP